MKAVTQWVPAIHKARGDRAPNISDATVLALIQVESAGDECAHRDHSRYWGLLQMYWGYVWDSLQDSSLPKERDLAERLVHCDGERSLEIFFDYMDRYELRHNFKSDQIAVIHKGGPRTASEVQAGLKAGLSLNAAIKKAEVEVPLKNLSEYVRRFRVARDKYRAWVDEQNQSCGDPVCRN